MYITMFTEPYVQNYTYRTLCTCLCTDYVQCCCTEPRCDINGGIGGNAVYGGTGGDCPPRQLYMQVNINGIVYLF